MDEALAADEVAAAQVAKQHTGHRHRQNAVADDPCTAVDAVAAVCGMNACGEEIWLTIASSCCMRLRASVSPVGQGLHLGD